MRATVEGVVYPAGNIRLFADVSYPTPRRALVTILDEPPRPSPLGLPADPGMRQPITFGTRIIDVDAIEDIVDEGDYVIVYFEEYHQPPYLLLYGDEAQAACRWMHQAGWYARRYDGELMSVEEIERLEVQVTASVLPPLEEVVHLLAELRRIRQSRDTLNRYNARILQSMFKHLEGLQQAIAANKMRTVGCILGEGCEVRADGSCLHTDKLEGLG